MEELQRRFEQATRRRGAKKAFYERAGLSRETVRRILRGDNVEEDSIQRMRAALGLQEGQPPSRHGTNTAPTEDLTNKHRGRHSCRR